MEHFTRALISIIGAGKVRSNPSTYRGNLDGAPQVAKDLVEALTTRSYHVDLGAYDMWAPNFMQAELWGVSEEIQQALDMVGSTIDEARPGFDPTKTVLLSADGGGMSMIALSWGREKLEGIVVEHADPTMENVVQFFSTAEEFIAFINAYNERTNVAPERPKGLHAIQAALKSG